MQRKAERLSVPWGELSDGAVQPCALVIPSRHSIQDECSPVKPLSGSPFVAREPMPGLFGEKLRRARIQQGLSQSELARRLGLARHTHISHLEAGRRAPSLDFVLRAACVLDVTTDYLLCDDVALEPVERSHADLSSPTLPLRLLGTKIRQLRVQRALTQVDLTKQLGLTSQGYVSKLEAGTKEPSPDLVVEMARFFGVTTDYLLRDDVDDRKRPVTHVV